LNVDGMRERHNDELEKVRKEKEPVKSKSKSYVKNREEEKSEIEPSYP
jgi:hypothetical protein